MLTYIAPCRSDWGLAKNLEKLQEIVGKLQRSLEADSYSRPSHAEVTLLQCAREVLVKGATVHEASLAAESIVGAKANNDIHVAEWVGVLDHIRQDGQFPDPSNTISNISSTFSQIELNTAITNTTSERRPAYESGSLDVVGDDSDDDLDTDLAKAALETGTKAFEARDWQEANSLLQEALRVLQRLPTQRRVFCDLFDLQFKLAVCAYYTQGPRDAEEALVSLKQQSVSSDEQRRQYYDATHLLSLLYIRLGQIERARSECERALQGRRRLLGKRNDVSLESTALMSHICALLNNHALAKSYLAMIPEPRRSTTVRSLEASLGTMVEHLDSPLPLTPAISDDSDQASKLFEKRFSTSSFAPSMENRCYGPISSTFPLSPASSTQQSHRRIPSSKEGVDDQQSVAITSLSSAEDRSVRLATETTVTNKRHTSDLEALMPMPLTTPKRPPEADPIPEGKPLSRKEILERIGCQPRDDLEEAVCNGDNSAFVNLLNKKKDFWRSKLRKRVRAERVTALHFAALFGEIDMARRLIFSNFNINEVPYGYSTSLSPLTFAIGARQVDMVEFLITNGAKPSEPDSWSTLAGQLMNRSWLRKTMSEVEKDRIPNRIIGILRILLKHGWDINAPYESSGATILHQAVTFWTGSYKWDLNLRTVVTSFLCERGADPFRANKEGKTPYDLASTSGHQDLLLVLSRDSKTRVPAYWPVEPVELPN